jgi:hypothetical protein
VFQNLRLSTSKPRRTMASMAGALMVLAFAAIALESRGRAELPNLPFGEEPPPTLPRTGVLLSADGELRLDGEIAAGGSLLPDGSRLDVVRGDALVQFDDLPLALLREGTSVRFDDAGAEATLYHGRARFEPAEPDAAPRALRVRAGQVDIDVLATNFTVERTRTDDRVRVTVRRGGAQVIGSNGQRSLRTGEETTVVRGRLGPVRAVSDRTLGEDRADAPALGRLKRRAGRLLDQWAR